MPPKKTEAQKQPDKAKKKQQLQLKRDLVKEKKQKELIQKYKDKKVINSISVSIPDLVYYDKKGNIKLIDPLTKAKNIRKVNKKTVIKFENTINDKPTITEGISLGHRIKLNTLSKSNISNDLYKRELNMINSAFENRVKDLNTRKAIDKNELIKQTNIKNKDIKNLDSRILFSDTMPKIAKKRENILKYLKQN